jgi:hypothetical protein
MVLVTVTVLPLRTSFGPVVLEAVGSFATLGCTSVAASILKLSARNFISVGLDDLVISCAGTPQVAAMVWGFAREGRDVSALLLVASLGPATRCDRKKAC